MWIKKAMKYRLLRSEGFCKWVIIYSTFTFTVLTVKPMLYLQYQCASQCFLRKFFPKCSQEGEFSAWANIMLRNLMERLPKHTK